MARTAPIISTETTEMTTPALYSGYLWRQGGQPIVGQGNTQKWIRRWFCLRPDRCLYFYKSDEVPRYDIIFSENFIYFKSNNKSRKFNLLVLFYLPIIL